MVRIQKGSGRRRRRQTRKGFPHRIVTYLDKETKRLVDAAIKATGESASMFAARALTQRAERVLNEPKEQK